jgi:hypothetical protein
MTLKSQPLGRHIFSQVQVRDGIYKQDIPSRSSCAWASLGRKKGVQWWMPIGDLSIHWGGSLPGFLQMLLFQLVSKVVMRNGHLVAHAPLLAWFYPANDILLRL